MRRSFLRGLVIFYIYHRSEDRARYQPFSSRYPVCFYSLPEWYLKLKFVFRERFYFKLFSLSGDSLLILPVLSLSGNSWQSLAGILLVLQLTIGTSKFILITYILSNGECGRDVPKIGLSIHGTSFPQVLSYGRQELLFIY